jgi:uncharacterized protein
MEGMRREKKNILMLLAVTASVMAGNVSAQDQLYPNEFPLGDVTLLDGPFKHAMEVNIKHLMGYTVDRLTASYYKEAGLTPKAADYSGGGAWDGLNGHVGGHYLSALAIQYAATGDAECKERLDYMVAELKKCQDENGKDADFEGYLSGIPNGKNFFREIKKGNTGVVWDYWVPWYNIHKTYAGLRDAWAYGQNEDAKLMFLKLCDWGMKICSGLSDAQMQGMLGNEHGGMNEMYADAYAMSNRTGSYMSFAKKFSHKDILDAMAQGRDNLDDKHANTQVPKVIGFQRIAEEANDEKFYKAAEFFWTTVVKNRSIAIGGNSQAEFFLKSSEWMEYINNREGVESCNTHNMLKLTEGLFRMKPEAKYADYYERGLFNHILSTQHPDHGGYVYFTSVHPRHYRVYSRPDHQMWCCVGTGMENHTKYGQFIYTHSNDSLFLNLFIASELDWKDKGVTVRQETTFPDTGLSVLTIGAEAPTRFTLMIRHPGWVHKGGMAVMIGNETLGLLSDSATYIAIDRTWNDGDEVKILMRMNFTVERMNNIPSWVAVMRGPIVMGSKISESPISNYVSGDGRWDHVANGSLLDPGAAPKLKIDLANLNKQFTPVAGKTQAYKAPGIFQNSAQGSLEFVPFSSIHDTRYMMYWNATVTGSYPPEDEIVKVAKIAKRENGGFAEIRQHHDALHFSFSATAPSRQVVLYTLAGKQVAAIAVPEKHAVLHLGKESLGMNNGMYVVEVVSEGKRISEKVCIAK